MNEFTYINALVITMVLEKKKRYGDKEIKNKKFICSPNMIRITKKNMVMILHLPRQNSKKEYESMK